MARGEYSHCTMRTRTRRLPWSDRGAELTEGGEGVPYEA